MGNFFVNLKKRLRIVRTKNFFTYRSGSKDDCNNKSEKKVSSKKTSSGSSIKKFDEMYSDGASGSRNLKRKVDEICSDSNLKRKNIVKGKKTNILNSAPRTNTYLAGLSQAFSSK